MTQLDIVGITEVAELLGVGASTVTAWYWRGLLPAPSAELALGPIWWRSTIDQWEPPRHHQLTGGKRGPSPKWLDYQASRRRARGDKPTEVAAWRKQMIARYDTLRAHGLKS